MRISSYVNFDGRCAEAFAFYAEVLGCPIKMTMRWRETPMADQVPAEMGDKIAHMQIAVGASLLMGSDVPPERYVKMSGTHVSVQVNSPEEATRVFAGLSAGGIVQMPLGPTFWSKAFGVFVDRYGIAWMVDCEPDA